MMIDGGIFIGLNPANNRSIISGPSHYQELENWMLKNDVQMVLASHYSNIFYNNRCGDDQIFALASLLPGKIIPTTLASPFAFRERIDRNYYSDLAKKGFKVFFVCTWPKYYDIPLDHPVLLHTARIAADAGMLLQIGLHSPEQFGNVERFWAKMDCPVMVRYMRGGAYQALSTYINLGLRYDNLYFDVSNITNIGGIRELSNSIGADRLFVASSTPETFFRPHVYLLESSGLSKKDVAMIRGGTLANLLDISFDAGESIFKEEAQEVFSKNKIDTHYHLGPLNLVEPETDETSGAIQFNIFNYEKVIVSSTKALNIGIEAGNLEAAKWSEINEKVYFLIVIDPLNYDLSCKQLKLYSHHPKAVGLKTIQDLFGKNLADDSYLRLWDANSKNACLPVLAHIPGMKESAELFPHITFVCAHTTLGRVKDKLGPDNIFYDISTSHNDLADTDYVKLVETVGEDKILFASDGPLVSPAWTLGKIMDSGLKTSIIQKILYDNSFKAFPKLSLKLV